jgi:hypothetical protein
MKLHVLFAQRKCDYPGQYALEALACMDENALSVNPDYMQGEYRKYKQTGEFDRLGVVELSVSEKAVREALYPEQKPIPATVIPAE